MPEVTLEAKIENIAQVTEFIDGQLEACEASIRSQMQIDVAIDELFGNIARYAYGETVGEATVRFEFDASTRTATITFIDGGMAFNPLETTDPDVTLAAHERSIGGLGIFLVKKTMDGMAYRRENDRNILTITKHI